MKKKFCTELAYVFGIVFVALGVVLMEKGDLGMSMIVVPAYLFYRWLSPIWPFFTFGMAEYCFQAVLLVVMAVILHKFRLSYLFSFVTAVVYGFVLDGFMLLGAMLPTDAMWQRVLYYVLGMLFCSAGVSAMFHTYISPEVYELFVKESRRTRQQRYASFENNPLFPAWPGRLGANRAGQYQGDMCRHSRAAAAEFPTESKR